MKKTYKQIFILLAVSVFIVPQIVLAAWWNPLSWSIWNIFRPTPHVEQIQIATTTPATSTATTAKKVDVNIKQEEPTNNKDLSIESAKKTVVDSTQKVSQPNIKQPNVAVPSQPIPTPAPSCTQDTWSCSDWLACSSSGSQTRSCNKTFECPSVVTQSPITSQSCTPSAPSCQADTWSCDDWNSCSASGNQTRSCTKTFDCLSVNTPSPTKTQSCTPPIQTETQTLSISVNVPVTTANSAQIAWNTNIPSSAKVFLTLDNGSIQVIPSASGYSTQHIVDVSNLKSATQYSYTIEAISGIQVKKLPGTILTICTPDWQCTEWSSCESSHQTRACGDLNRCGVSTAKPISTQSCTMPAPQPTANVTVSTQSLNTQTVQPGNNVVLGKINITYDNEVRHKIAEKPLRLTVGGGGSTSNLSNCRLFNSNAGLVVSAAIYGPVTGKNIFSTDVDGLLDVVCDVANNTSNGSTFSWGINSNDWSNVFEAMYNYSLENDITTSMGQTVTVIN